MPSASRVSVADEKAGNRTLVPFLDLSQDCLQIIRNRFATFTCVMNFDGFHGHRVGKIRLARRAVDLVREVIWHDLAKLNFQCGETKRDKQLFVHRADDGAFGSGASRRRLDLRNEGGRLPRASLQGGIRSPAAIAQPDPFQRRLSWSH
jgi:hypothetical protein